MYLLNALWRGEIAPNEYYTKPDSNYRCLAARLRKESELFRQELSEEGKAHFDEFEKIMNEMRSIKDEELFIEAFCMGARMILDIISERQDQTQQDTAG